MCVVVGQVDSAGRVDSPCGSAARTRGTVSALLRSKLERPGPLDVYFGNLTAEDLTTAERCFFGRLQLSNGTYKTTMRHRLDDLNDLVAAMMPRGRCLAVMDVAVSSGVSSAEWSQHLDAAGIPHRMTAGDLAVDAILLTLGRSVAALWQDDGHPLVVQVGRYSLYLVRSGFMRFIAKCFSPFLRVLYLLAGKLRFAPDEAKPVKGRARVRRVALVSRLVAANRTIQVICDDILDGGTFVEQFDVCRAANIMNRQYFGDDVLTAMAHSLLARIREGGLLVVCRTVPTDEGYARNRASVLRKSAACLEVLARLNGGCDIEGLLCAPRGDLTLA